MQNIFYNMADGEEKSLQKNMFSLRYEIIANKITAPLPFP